MPAAPYDSAAEVAGLLDALDVGTAAVVASSGGGRVAIELAARWPRRVTALALLSTAMFGHAPSPELRAFGEREDELLAAGDVAATRAHRSRRTTPMSSLEELERRIGDAQARRAPVRVAACRPARRPEKTQSASDRPLT